MIDGKTQLVGLIGWPVGHSLSPAMHNAAFAALNLNWRYLPLPVSPGQLPTAVRGLAALGFRGANVTVPHKQALRPLLDIASPEVEAAGACNTLVCPRSRSPQGTATITGHNTDLAGVLGALRDGAIDPAALKSAVVVGAGGAARAVVAALLEAGPAQVTVLNRTLAHAEGLVAALAAGREDAVHLAARPLTPETLIESTRAADLLVNATGVGMEPATGRSIWPDDVPLPGHVAVLDLVYAPLETRLLRQAKRSGARPLDGLGMLVWQGAAAFELWTGRGPVEEIAALMRRACEEALRR